MPETLAAIDRALATPPDPHRALTIGCGFCGVTVPFHSHADMGIFFGHHICRLAGGLPPVAPADTAAIEYVSLKEACFRTGKKERTVLRWAHARGAARRFGGRWLINVGKLPSAVGVPDRA